MPSFRSGITTSSWFHAGSPSRPLPGISNGFPLQDPHIAGFGTRSRVRENGGTFSEGVGEPLPTVFAANSGKPMVKAPTEIKRPASGARGGRHGPNGRAGTAREAGTLSASATDLSDRQVSQTCAQSGRHATRRRVSPFLPIPSP